MAVDLAPAIGAERYVRTSDAEVAVLNRETELIDALGIRWRDGNPHITCPLTARHQDQDPSFRWDREKRRAFCNCIQRWHPRGHKSLGVLDVVAEVQGLTFSDAKVWACEQLGRTDVIKTKGGSKSRASGVTALLNPPIHLRDDAIVQNYLALRLGVAPADAPMPTTPVAGHTSLAYYDPPPPGTKEFPKVGDWPCAVFGMTDIAGAIHAQRIYVRPNGAGKAELPTLPNGKRRKVKKLAPVPDGFKSAGLGVVWGDLATATWSIITEGVETAAAVAYAFRDTVGLAVVATISTSGMIAFRPGPACQYVLVAADRDEGEGHASKGGEVAARDWCTQYWDRLERGVGYALPGQPGTYTDWLDILRNDGPEAVRAGILGCNKFEPQTEDIERHRKQVFTLEPKLDNDGNYRPVHINAVILLDRCLGSALGYDAFTQRMVFEGEPPWVWHAEARTAEREVNDDFIRGAMIYLQNQNCFIRSPVMVHDALIALAQKRRFSSLQRYLDGCVVTPGPQPNVPWPTSIDTFLIDVLGVPEFGPLQALWHEESRRFSRPLTKGEEELAALHSRYVRAQSSNFFKRAVGRARQPGIKCDEALNIPGPEGVGKSTVLRRLFEPWFSDRLPPIGNKDADLQLAGIWVLELGDGSHIKKTDPDDFKKLDEQSGRQVPPALFAPGGRFPPDDGICCHDQRL